MRRCGVLLAVLVLAGCAVPVAGTPAPVDPTGVAAELPPRPRVVTLDGVDPCGLWTDAERAELGLEPRAPLLDIGLSAFYGGETRQCTSRGYDPRAISLSIELSVTGGIELWLRPGVPAELRPIEVRGFPAVVVKSTRLQDFCSVIVDVAPGQVVDAQFADGGRLPPISQDDLCVDAQRMAEVVMGNLLAQR